MKVIDFLVELEKGNIPEKIIYDDCLFVYDSEGEDYKNNKTEWFFENYIRDISILSEEIMIINDENDLSINKNDFDKLVEERAAYKAKLNMVKDLVMNSDFGDCTFKNDILDILGDDKDEQN